MSTTILSTTVANCNTEFPNCRNVSGFLRRVTSRILYGRATDKGPRPYFDHKEKCIDYFNEHGFGQQWSSFEFDLHERGERNLYFYGNSDPRCLSLITIDIDVQKKLGLGSAEGALACAQHFARLLPGLLCQRSAGGKGMACYFLLDPADLPFQQQRLQDFAKWVLDEGKHFDIEKAELKGTPCRVVWAGREIDSITYGMLSRLPKNATLEELYAMPVVKQFDLPQPLSAISVIEDPKPKTEDWNPLVSVGSVSFDYGTQETFKRLKVFCERFEAKAEHMAVALQVLMICKANPNPDDQLPSKRIAYHWNMMVDYGFTTKRFDGELWAKLRNELSSCGLLDWLDNRYWFKDAGCAHKSRCMKFRLTDQFNDLLLAVVGTDVVDLNAADRKQEASIYGSQKQALSEADAYIATDPWADDWCLVVGIGKNLRPEWCPDDLDYLKIDPIKLVLPFAA